MRGLGTGQVSGIRIKSEPNFFRVSRAPFAQVGAAPTVDCCRRRPRGGAASSLHHRCAAFHRRVMALCIGDGSNVNSLTACVLTRFA